MSRSSFSYFNFSRYYNSITDNNEKEFLENYDITKFDRLSMTSDILLISVSSKDSINYRKTSTKMISILLVKRDDFPFKGKWCLPGGFVNPKNETLDECAKRILKKETNLSNIYLEQLYTFDDIKRDPRTRVVSTAYMALVDKNKLENNISQNASWFDITEFTSSSKSFILILFNSVPSSLKSLLSVSFTDSIFKLSYLLI